MSKQRLLFCFILITGFISCNTSKKPDIHFIDKFPEHYRNLTHALPDTFRVKYNTSDTSQFVVNFNKNTNINYIVDIENNDTLFKGFAAKFKGLYFLSRKINDSSFHIHALHTDGYTIKGLHTEALQIKLIERNLNTNLSSLIINKNDSIISLNPSKEVLFSFFKHMLTKLRGDTILEYDYHMKYRNQEKK